MARAVVTKIDPRIHGWHDQPHLRCCFKIADVNNLQALGRGDASPEQQQAALKWIGEVAGMVYDETFDASSERVSAFMQGRRYVGQRLAAMCKILPGALADIEERRIAEETRKTTRSPT